MRHPSVWWIALALSFLPATALVLNLSLDRWRVCEDVVSRVGTSATARACHPPRTSELVVLLLPVGVLLFPQIAELTIPGVISLKQRVERQEDEQRRLREEVVSVKQQVSQNVINVFGRYFDTAPEKRPDVGRPQEPE